MKDTAPVQSTGPAPAQVEEGSSSADASDQGEMLALSVLMDNLAGNAEPNPDEVFRAWSDLGVVNRDLVLTDATMGPKARALGLHAIPQGAAGQGEGSFLSMIVPDTAIGARVTDWWNGEDEEEEHDTSDGGWGDYVPGFARGFYDGFYGKEDAPESEESEEAPEEAQAQEGDPTLQIDLVEEMLDIGYNDDGTQATRYGGFSGKGSEYSMGEGGYWAVGADPIRCLPHDTGEVDKNGDPIVEYRWFGKSGKDYGKFPEKTFVANDEYHCVGAVSAVLEKAGMYEGNQRADGAADVTHKKDGTWREKVTLDSGKKKDVTRGKAEGVQTRGGGSGDYSLKALVNVATFDGKADLKAATASDGAILTAAKKAATEEADAQIGPGGFTGPDDPRYAEFVLRTAYDALMSSDKRDERLAGAATALEKGGFGAEINPCDAKPGDICQHWSDSTSGHATLVHVVESLGVAKVDERGKVSADGTWKDGAFSMDDKSDPGLVGKHIVQNVRLLGAHSVGSTDYNQGEKKATDGIHTGAARAVGSKVLEYYGRPDNSRWNGWTARFPSVADALASESGPEPAKGGAGEADWSQYGWGEWLGGGAKMAAEQASSVKAEVASRAYETVWGPGEEEGGEAQTAEPSEPAKSPEASTRACPGVKQCDYLQHADGRIELTAPGSRMFSPGDELYDAILAEIEGVYGKWVT